MTKRNRQIRRCPYPFPGSPRGSCRLCGEPILRADGTVNKLRTWHAECGYFFRLCTEMPLQRSFLYERDGDGCAHCKTKLRRLVKYTERYNIVDIDADGTRHYYPWTELKLAWVCEVDHRIPLWKVETVSDVRARVWYFGPDNLQLLCPPCHAEKTSLETTERAHERRMTKGIRRRKGPPMRSRGFDKTFTRRFDGTTVRKEK